MQIGSHTRRRWGGKGHLLVAPLGSLLHLLVRRLALRVEPAGGPVPAGTPHARPSAAHAGPHAVLAHHFLEPQQPPAATAGGGAAAPAGCAQKQVREMGWSARAERSV
jgi:hypothetical protein